MASAARTAEFFPREPLAPASRLHHLPFTFCASGAGRAQTLNLLPYG